MFRIVEREPGKHTLTKARQEGSKRQGQKGMRCLGREGLSRKGHSIFMLGFLLTSVAPKTAVLTFFTEDYSF